MTKRKRQSRLRHGADPMQPRVYQEPSAPDEPATSESTTPAVVPGPSGAVSAEPPTPEATATPSPAPPPSATLPVAVPVREIPPAPAQASPAPIATAPPTPVPATPAPPPPPPAAPAIDTGKQLEDRLNKLEAVLKTIRVQQFTTAPAAPPTPSMMLPGADVLLGAGQILLPLATQAVQPLTDPTRAAAVAATLRTDGPLLFEIYAELRCMVRMYLDPRYRLSWATKFVPVGLLALMVFAWISVSGMVYIGPILDRLAFAVLLYLLYKVLGREAQRYRQTSPDLPPSLRL